jgi:hypothetical protein
VITILRCKGCGAALRYDPEHQAPSCSFCGSVVESETVQDPLEQTEGYLPFTISDVEARTALKAWLGSLGWFRPSDLKQSSRLEKLKPLWWVAWVFDADCLISWAADSNAGAGRSSWAPHAGQTNVNFRRILASASRGLSASEVDTIARGMDLSRIEPEPLGADDATIEQFDVQRSQARQQVSATLDAMAEKHVREHSIPGSNFRNVHVSVVVEGLITHRLSLPAYVMAYRYKDKLYRVVICGQNANDLTGSAPYSKAKIVLTVVGAVAAALLLLALFAAG